MPDGSTGPSDSDPDRDMLPGEPSRNANPTSPTSNPGVSGTGGQGMQAAGGRDEGKRGFDAAKAGVGGFGSQTLTDRTRSWMAENTPSLFALAIPGANALSRMAGVARSAGYDVQDVATPDDGGAQGQAGNDFQRDRSKALSNAAAASDAERRSSVNAANDASSFNASSLLNRSGYSSANRRRRSLFDSGMGAATLGGA